MAILQSMAPKSILEPKIGYMVGAEVVGAKFPPLLPVESGFGSQSAYPYRLHLASSWAGGVNDNGATDISNHVTKQILATCFRLLVYLAKIIPHPGL